MTDLAPAIKLEVAFDAAPFDTSPSWTDLTPWLRADSGTRGRTFELDKVQTGTRTFILDNTDGRFTPDKVSIVSEGSTVAAPFLGKLKPRRPVRVTITIGSTTYARFYGYTARWQTTAPNGGDYVEATLTAVDGYDYFSRLPLTTPYRAEVLSDDPKAYWPLTTDGVAPIFGGAEGNISKYHEGPMYIGAFQGDTPDADFRPNQLVTAVTDIVVSDGSYSSLQFGTEDAYIGTSGVYARTLDVNTLGFQQATFQGISNTPDYTAELWMTALKEPTPGEVVVVQMNQALSYPAWTIVAAATGSDYEMRFYTANDGSSYEHVDLTGLRNSRTSSDPLYVVEPHHIAVTHTGLTRGSWGVQKVYVDGSLVATVDLTGDYAVSASYHHIGGAVYGPPIGV